MKNLLLLFVCCLALSTSAFSQLQITFTTDSVSCFGERDGNITAVVTGGTSPYTYLWSTSDVTASLTGVAVGMYDVTVTDAVGDTLAATGYVFGPAAMSFTFTMIPSNCGLPNGSASVDVQNGTQPLTYAWSNSTSGSAILNVPAGGYSVTVTDANGCERHANVVVTEDSVCFAVLRGIVYLDTDSNCVQDGNDWVAENVLVEVGPGILAYTSFTGYSVQVPADNYQVKPVTGGAFGYTVTCPGAAGVPVTANGGDRINVADIGIKESYTDYSIVIPCNNVRVNRIATQGVYVYTNSSAVTNLSGYVQLDTLMTNPVNPYIGTNLRWDSVSTTVPIRVYFTINSLNPYQRFVVQVKYTMPAAPLNKPVHLEAHLFNTDDYTDNNHSTCDAVTMNSADPNDKQVSSGGKSVDGLALPTDTTLLYQIRFQNMGNDTAYQVTIRDTLDLGLNARSFQLLGASHPCRIEFDADNIIHFVFDDINLPDTAANFAESQGYVLYSIKVAEPEVLDVPIFNQAAIYFDFNDPIYTNVVQTLRQTPADTSIGIETLATALLSVYPNPANSQVNVSLQGQPINSIALYDLAGKLVMQQTGLQGTTHRWSVSDIAHGLYLLEVRSGDKVYRTKLVLNND